jgi:hypothetical protein
MKTLHARPSGRRFPLPARAAAVALAAAALGAGCGSDDDGDSSAQTPRDGDLSAVKTYLTTHTTELNKQVDVLHAEAESYYKLAESVGFDYERLLAEHQPDVQRILDRSKKAFVVANPAYEEMEGIVAGVPRLAQYDVDIDAGADASDPENAVSFSLDLPNGKKLKQPGNLFFLTETALYGTNPDLTAKGVEGDVDGSGKVEFGEGLPDANIYVSTLRKFDEMTDDLEADGNKFKPSPSDAFTAITVMTPTMSEYFEAWKNSRFIAGDKAKEEGFVATSRLSDIADILEGIKVTYRGIEPSVAQESPEQARQTGASLDELIKFVEDLRDREQRGQKFTPEQADTLGSEAQKRAEDIAGQVTQSAKRLSVDLQES